MCFSIFFANGNRIIEISKKTIKANKHPHLEQNNINEVIAKIKGFEEDLKEFRESINLQIEEAEKEINSVKVKDDDDVLKAINKHFSVGSGYSFEQIMEITKEGKHRYEFRIPPGYGDYYKKEKKGTQIFGDLIIWKQILDYAKNTEKPINDLTKDEDWCYLEKRSNENRVLAPREELIKELYDHAKVEFWMYSLPQFLHYAKESLKADIPEQAIQFIAQHINTTVSRGNYLKVQCANCDHIHNFHKTEFDFAYSANFQ